MFRASPGNIMVGADFSQQEPRLMANFSGDEHMIGAYQAKKDLYSTVAAKMFNNTYEDNLEFAPDGTPNPAGKARRSNAKAVVMGLLYGRGAASVAEQIGKTKEEAQQIIDSFFNGFPKVKEWINATQTFAKAHGYVEDLYGRRRRLPEINLPKYTIKLSGKKETSLINFNPLLGSEGKFVKQEAPEILKYRRLLSTIRSRAEYNKIKAQAAKEGVTIIDNGGFISQAERQCVNARIQGSAASLTKRAMRRVYDDPELKEWGFKLLITVHDELIGECPVENGEKVMNKLSSIMINAALPECIVPMKCDGYCVSKWYADDYSNTIREKYLSMLEKDHLTEAEALNKIYENNEMLSHECLKSMAEGTFDVTKPFS